MASNAHANLAGGSGLVERYKVNQFGTDYICGDVHGQFDELTLLLQMAGFDERTDRLYAVGDLVDRGPKCLHLPDWLGKSWFHTVRGNHDQGMVVVTRTGEVHEKYASEGGQWFLDLDQPLREVFAELACTMPFAIELETKRDTVGIVHAASLPSWPQMLIELEEWNSLSASSKRYLYHKCLWSRSKYDTQNTDRIDGVDRLFVGHKAVPQRMTLGNVHYIDTGCGKGGHLTLIDLNDDTRVFTLPNPPIYVPKLKPVVP